MSKSVKRNPPPDPRQLNLFDPAPEAQTPLPALPKLPKNPTVIDFLRARLDYGPDMSPEDYKRWVKILIHHSLKSM